MKQRSAYKAGKARLPGTWDTDCIVLIYRHCLPPFSSISQTPSFNGSVLHQSVCIYVQNKTATQCNKVQLASPPVWEDCSAERSVMALSSVSWKEPKCATHYSKIRQPYSLTVVGEQSDQASVTDIYSRKREVLENKKI